MLLLVTSLAGIGLEHLHVVFPGGCLVSSQHSYWVPEISIPRRVEESCIAFYDSLRGHMTLLLPNSRRGITDLIAQWGNVSVML